MNIDVKKKTAAFISIVSNATLIILKLVAGFISGSVSVISEAIHSLGDLTASCLAFFSVSKSAQPPDIDHPFGHGKYEDMAGFIEAGLILFTSFYIFYIAGRKIYLNYSEPIDTNLGIIVMAISIVMNIIVSWYLYHVAKESDSIALYTDAQHLSADILTSVAILAGLFFVKITGLYIFDPIFAIIVATLILRTGLRLSKQSLNNLLDGSLPKKKRDVLDKILQQCTEDYNIKIKSIKTTKSGPMNKIQLVIYFSSGITLGEAHKICDKIENCIEEKLKNSDIIIHPEPF
jgi:cation diffusion facilitator family transporter